MAINELYTYLSNIIQTNPQIKSAVDQAFLSSRTTIEFLLHLCDIITNKITIWQTTYYNKQTNQSYLVTPGRRRDKNMSIEEEQQIMVFATQLIYALRTFITDSNIDFLFGATLPNGEHISAIIPQEQVLANLSVTRRKAIGVTLSLQTELIKAQQNNDVTKIRQDHWKLIESLAEPEYSKTAKYRYVRDRSGRAHRAYQSQKQDFKVYLSFFGKQPMKYYGESLIHFNNGWLWEWYNNIYYNASDAEYAEVEASLLDGSLEPLIDTPDFIRGTKQGDFVIASRNQDIQAKYNNIKIISYNNIREIIYELRATLLLLQVEGSNSAQGQAQLTALLQKHFIPETARKGQKTIEQYTEKLIKEFKEAISH